MNSSGNASIKPELMSGWSGGVCERAVRGSTAGIRRRKANGKSGSTDVRHEARFGQTRPSARTSEFGHWIGVGNGVRRPLPPNPVCGFPATGSPVSCFHIGMGAPIEEPRTS
jgi:hypothetical protein